jgi:hypothetical protein
VAVGSIVLHAALSAAVIGRGIDIKSWRARFIVAAEDTVICTRGHYAFVEEMIKEDDRVKGQGRIWRIRGSLAKCGDGCELCSVAFVVATGLAWLGYRMKLFAVESGSIENVADLVVAILFVRAWLVLQFKGGVAVGNKPSGTDE